MAYPTIGVPYHPAYTNPAFFQAIARLQALGFNILQLDCRYDNMAHLKKLVAENMTLIDGLLLPGSMYDIPPKFYSEPVTNKDALIGNDDRAVYYQLKMIDAARKLNMPILGICAGANLLHIALGGKLNQDITKQAQDGTLHDKDPRDGEVTHAAYVKKGTHLHDILSGQRPAKEDIKLAVNSWHHTANTLCEKVMVSAVAPDGIIEGIEEAPQLQIKIGKKIFDVKSHPNCWGIQFHPEYLDLEKTPQEARQLRILDAFKTASLSFKVKREVTKAITHLFSLKKPFKIDGDKPKQSDTIKTALKHMK